MNGVLLKIATDQYNYWQRYFPSKVMSIMLYKVVITFEAEDEILVFKMKVIEQNFLDVLFVFCTPQQF